MRNCQWYVLDKDELAENWQREQSVDWVDRIDRVDKIEELEMLVARVDPPEPVLAHEDRGADVKEEVTGEIGYILENLLCDMR